MLGMAGARNPVSLVLLALGLVAVAAGLGVSGRGQDAGQRYATGWNAVCRDVSGAMSTFRTAVSSAVEVDHDATERATPAEAIRSHVATPARVLDVAVTRAFSNAADLEPTEAWRAWHASELGRLAARRSVLELGVQRLEVGDTQALPLLAIGAVGPASVRAPAALRDRTPECTTLS
jgi:hypothetical protein